MDLSDKSLSLRRSSSNKKPDKYSRASPEKKIACVTKWLALGNLRLVADLEGVKYETITYWKNQPWWNDIVAEVKASRNAQLDSKLSKIVDRALETIADRLENGNVKYDFKKGEVVREPVTLKDATTAAKALMDQQMNMEKLKVVEKTADVQLSVQDQIKMLAQEFARFNTKRTVEMPKAAGNDEGITDAVYEERETGLQEGGSSVYLEAGSSEEEDDAERSQEGSGETRFGAEG